MKPAYNTVSSIVAGGAAPTDFGDGYTQASEAARRVIAIMQDEIADLRAQVETLTQERDFLSDWRGGTAANLREIETALVVERKKVRRLVECVREIAQWNNDVRYGSLKRVLATVSDITAPTDEMKPLTGDPDRRDWRDDFQDYEDSLKGG